MLVPFVLLWLSMNLAMSSVVYLGVDHLFLFHGWLMMGKSSFKHFKNILVFGFSALMMMSLVKRHLVLVALL
jgi:hypothetical protein